MEPATNRLWNRDFSLLSICTVIALLGNMTISVALAFYVRDITGSEAMFGLALSAPYISLLVMSPIGGIIADRLRKQLVMFSIDAFVAVLILVYLVSNNLFTMAIIPIAFVKLFVLNAAQGAYMSTLQAAIPFIVPKDKLPTANAFIGVVNALVSAGGAALAAVLYENFGLSTILILFAVVYAFIAILDLFIRVPYKKQKAESSVIQLVKSDMSQAIRFTTKDKPVFAKLAIIAFFVFATGASLLMVGTPILVTETLNMDLSFVGIINMLTAVGGLGGGILASSLGTRLSIEKCPFLLLILSILPILISLAILLDIHTTAVFVVLAVVSAFSMFILTLVLITTITFVQTETPSELLGKVLALFSMLPFLGQAVGQFAFGVLFETLETIPWAVILISVFISTMVAMYSRKHLANAD